LICNLVRDAGERAELCDLGQIAKRVTKQKSSPGTP
jgi:hypothetical protein